MPNIDKIRVDNVDYNVVGSAESLPVGSEIDYDGATVPDGWQVVDNKIKLLWENSNPTINFSAQNITLSSSDYDLLLFIYATNTNNTQQQSNIIKKGKGTFVSWCYYSAALRAVVSVNREINWIDNTTMQIANATSNGNSANDANIPIAFYGIKL